MTRRPFVLALCVSTFAVGCSSGSSSVAPTSSARPSASAEAVAPRAPASSSAEAASSVEAKVMFNFNEVTAADLLAALRQLLKKPIAVDSAVAHLLDCTKVTIQGEMVTPHEALLLAKKALKPKGLVVKETADEIRIGEGSEAVNNHCGDGLLPH